MLLLYDMRRVMQPDWVIIMLHVLSHISHAKLVLKLTYSNIDCRVIYIHSTCIYKVAN